MRRFASDRVNAIMERLRIPDDMPIEAGMVTKAIERAQAQVESQNFEIRKNVLKYDEVMNRQREVIYAWRNRLLRGEASDELVRSWIGEIVEDTVTGVFGEVAPYEWDWDELRTQIGVFFETEVTPEAVDDGCGIEVGDVVDYLIDEAQRFYDEREQELGAANLRQLERNVVLAVIDNKWREHLAEMDYLRAGIGLRAMGQRDPLVEYQREAFDMFAELVETVKRDTLRYLFHVQVVQEAERAKQEQLRHQQEAAAAGGRPTRQAVSNKIGRNDPCPCGSGKKYKHCHGKRT
jgi:preprotein translocase subunit SecA